MTPLSADQIRDALGSLPSWEPAEGAITAECRFDDFRQAVAFVVRVAFEAEAADHHPDIDVRYNRVRLTLSTHSAGGVTAKDLELASVIQRLAGR